MRRGVALVMGLVLVALAWRVADAGQCGVFMSFSETGSYSSSDLNQSFVQAATTNSTLACVDAISANVAAMQATTNPGLVGTESLATSAQGEIERLRYVIKELTGWPQWYAYDQAFTRSRQAGLVFGPYGAAAGNTGEVRFLELAANGTNYVGFKAPDAIAASGMWTLPNADGASGAFLQTDGSGALSWTTQAVVTGSGANTRLAYFTGASALAADAALTFNATSKQLSHTLVSLVDPGGDFGLLKVLYTLQVSPAAGTVSAGDFSIVSSGGVSYLATTPLASVHAHTAPGLATYQAGTTAYGVLGTTIPTASSGPDNLFGVAGLADSPAASVITAGIFGRGRHTGSGITTSGYGVVAEYQHTGVGTTTTGYGAYVAPVTKTAGAITTAYGLYVSEPTGGNTNIGTYLGGWIQSAGKTLATLGTPANGTIIYCSNCDPVAVGACTAAGAQTGALAIRLNGAWVCAG